MFGPYSSNEIDRVTAAGRAVRVSLSIGRRNATPPATQPSAPDTASGLHPAGPPSAKPVQRRFDVISGPDLLSAAWKMTL